MGTFSAVLACLLAGAVAFTSAQPTPSHYGGGYSSRVGALSVYNPSTKHYEPVTWDRQYTYYRLKYNLEQTFLDSFNPDGEFDPTGPTVISIVISGNVYDNSTGTKVGTWDSSHITTKLKANNELQFLSTLALELGLDGDDTIFLAAAFDRANFNQEPTDYEAAVTGGTGRYKGATGEVLHFGPDLAGFNNVYVAEFAVPRFKRF